MGDRVLIVDDEKNLLNAIYRQLRKRFEIETALGPEPGLAAVREKGPFAVVVSDLRMPVMDGIQFLSRVRDVAPETVRMMLTGNADLGQTIQAVNEGNIFRFFTKPCPAETLAEGIHAGIKQFRLVTAERELLQKTLKGSIQVLSEVLSLVNPEAFGRASRIRRYVKQIVSRMEVKSSWSLELAAMMSQIGCVALPEAAVRKADRGIRLDAAEGRVYERHPAIASELISKIPRLEKVAEIVLYQEKYYDGTGFPDDDLRGDVIPLGSRILKVALDFDRLEIGGMSKSEALMKMKTRSCRYDPKVLEALASLITEDAVYFVRDVTVEDLSVCMIINDDVWTLDGQMVIAKGQEVGSMLMDRLQSFARTRGIKEPINVLIPSEKPGDSPSI